MKYRARTNAPHGFYPMGVSNYKSGYYSYIRSGLDKDKFSKMEPYDPSDHETLLQKGVKHLIHHPYEMFTKESPSHQTIPGHSIVVYLNPLMTAIDKALESFQLERFVVK
jgi:hypothetical protein